MLTLSVSYDCLVRDLSTCVHTVQIAAILWHVLPLNGSKCARVFDRKIQVAPPLVGWEGRDRAQTTCICV